MTFIRDTNWHMLKQDKHSMSNCYKLFFIIKTNDCRETFAIIYIAFHKVNIWSLDPSTIMMWKIFYFLPLNLNECPKIWQIRGKFWDCLIVAKVRYKYWARLGHVDQLQGSLPLRYPDCVIVLTGLINHLFI